VSLDVPRPRENDQLNIATQRCSALSRKKTDFFSYCLPPLVSARGQNSAIAIVCGWTRSVVLETTRPLRGGERAERRETPRDERERELSSLPRHARRFRGTIERTAILHEVVVAVCGNRKETNHLVLPTEKECRSRGKRGARLEDSNGVAEHVRRVTSCIECSRDNCSPNNEGENTPRVENATSGPVNSQARHPRKVRPPPCGASVPLVCSKKSADFLFRQTNTRAEYSLPCKAVNNLFRSFFRCDWIHAHLATN